AVGEKRGQTEMDRAVVERRAQRGEQLFRRVPLGGLSIAIRHAEKTRSRADPQSAALDLHFDLVEDWTARFLGKCRLGGRVANQVVTTLILNRAAQAEINVVVVMNEK